jgi:vacuolar-type H+-ATPase subunit B/Vma2
MAIVFYCPLAGLPHNDIAAQICRQAGLVKHEGRAGEVASAALLLHTS